MWKRMGKVERKCLQCGDKIIACFGFVFARVILDEYKPGTYVPELCAKCGVRYLFEDYKE